MVGNIDQLHSFYESISPKLENAPLEEVTLAVASVLAALPSAKIYETLQVFCQPIIQRLMQLAEAAKEEKGDVDKRRYKLAGNQTHSSSMALVVNIL